MKETEPATDSAKSIIKNVVFGPGIHVGIDEQGRALVTCPERDAAAHRAVTGTTMTPAEQFDKACDNRWANDPNRHSKGRYFFEAACEVYMQEHVLHWGRELHAFEPDDMKMLGRWLNKCDINRGE